MTFADMDCMDGMDWTDNMGFVGIKVILGIFVLEP